MKLSADRKISARRLVDRMCNFRVDLARGFGERRAELIANACRPIRFRDV